MKSTLAQSAETLCHNTRWRCDERQLLVLDSTAAREQTLRRHERCRRTRGRHASARAADAAFPAIIFTFRFMFGLGLVI